MSRETTIPELSVLRESVFAGRLSALVGAGVSKPSPSNLPTAGEMMICMLRGLLSPEAFARSVDLLDSERPERHSRKDFIRFESLVQTVATYSHDKNLTFLDYLADCHSPNGNHLLLAGLIEKRCPVLTTNFDDLIETACKRRGFESLVVADESAFENWKSTSNDRCLFKLHGSFRIGGRDSRGSLRASLDTIVRAGNTAVMMEPSKFAVVTAILSVRDLLVMGYSGADDFDILPALEKIHAPGRRIIWINHTPSPDFRLFRFEDLQSYPRDKEGFLLAERIRLLHSLVRTGARNPDDIILIDCNTGWITEFLEEVCDIPRGDDAEPYELDLEQFMARWFRRYLPDKSTRWYIGSIVLFDRERYDDSLRLLDQVIADSAHDPDRFVKATQAKINYYLRNRDFAAASEALAAIVAAVNSHKQDDVKGMYWHQVGYVEYNLGEADFFKHRWKEARSRYQHAFQAYQKAMLAWKAVRDDEGMSATLHQLGLLFARLIEPERFQTMAESEGALDGYVMLFTIGRQKVSDRIRTAFKKVGRSLKRLKYGLQRRWYLRKALRSFQEAMDIAKQAGMWQRYCESVSQMASILHLKREYGREIDFLTDALRQTSLAGRTYITGGAFGQLGYALLFRREYRRAHASLLLAKRLSERGGGVYTDAVKSGFTMLEEKVGGAELGRQRDKLEPLENRELAEIALKTRIT